MPAVVTSKTVPRVIALAFTSAQAAREAMASAMRFHDEELLTVEDAVFLTCHEDGTVEVSEPDPTPIAAAVPSSLFGALVGTLVAGPLGLLIGGLVAGSSGALVAKLVDTGIPDRVVGELRELTRPGQTVLALMVRDVAGMAMIEELRRFQGARVVYAPIPAEALALAQDVLPEARI